MSKATKGWLKGLAAAAITGAAGAIAAGWVDPATFNPFFGGTWAKLGQMALANAFIGLMAYLKASPIPPPKNENEEK